jgi:endogenous inhibitor of DNA gyrase (YacG/DUF329 family)
MAKGKHQRCCPATEEERSRSARSWCSDRYYRHIHKGGPLKGQPPQPLDCARCGVHCVQGKDGVDLKARKFCSKDCKARYHRPNRPKQWPACRVKKRKTRRFIEGHCPECGDRFVRNERAGAVGYCAKKCQVKAKARRHEAFKRGAGRKTLTFWTIAERDNFDCQLCGEPVLMDETAPHRLSPSLDHIVPLSRGGSHCEGNVQLTHFLCNSVKSDGSAVPIGGQLSMV